MRYHQQFEAVFAQSGTLTSGSPRQDNSIRDSLSLLEECYATE